MAHRIFPGEGLATRYAAAPQVRVSTFRDGRPVVRLRYASSAATQGNPFRVTELRFDNVVDFRWADSEFGLVSGNSRDVALMLIEITDSELIRRLLEQGKYSSFPLGQRLGGVLGEADLRHYRITFDDHGGYDVVCRELAITYDSSTDDDLYP